MIFASSEGRTTGSFLRGTTPGFRSPTFCIVRKRSVAFDVLLASAALVLGQIEVWGSGNALATHRQGPHWAQALCYGIPAVLLAFRRVRPMPVLLAMIGVMVV